MNIHFNGIKHITGPNKKPEELEDYAAQLADKSITTLPAFDKGAVILLDGKDSVDFLKKEYDVEFPPEYQGLSIQQMDQYVAKMKDPTSEFSPLNIAKKYYSSNSKDQKAALATIQKLMRFQQFILTFERLEAKRDEIEKKIIQYYEQKKAQGAKDAEGQPIQEITL